MYSHKIKYYFLSLLLLPNLVIAQRPREVQVDNDPVDWSNPVNVVVLIVIPVLMLLTGFILRARYFKNKKTED